MKRSLTIIIRADVYEGLQWQVDAEDVSQFIKELLCLLIADDEALETAYRETVSNVEREREAMEWSVGVPDYALE